MVPLTTSQFLLDSLTCIALWSCRSCSAPEITSLSIELNKVNGTLVAPVDPVAALQLLSTEGGDVLLIGELSLDTRAIHVLAEQCYCQFTGSCCVGAAS